MTKPLPLSKAAARMAMLCSGIAEDVAAIVDLYDADPTLNESQPRAFAAMLPRSADEWLFDIREAADAWKECGRLARIAEAAAPPPPDGIELAAALLAEWNFEQGADYPNGDAWQVTDGGGRICVTGADGSGAPSIESFAVCYYPPEWDGEQLALDLRSDSGLTFRQAIAAAVGALHGERG